MTDIPVRKEMLVWAREFRGLSVEEAAEKLSLPVDDIRALEDGTHALNLTQYRRYSEKLRIPLATLLRQTAPTTPPMPIDFRTFGGVSARLGFEVRLAISYAYTIEQNVLELVDADAAPATPALPVLTLRHDPSVAGERERQRLGVSVARQLAWNRDEAFRMWRTVIEATGSYVLQRKFDLQDCKGFSIFRNPNAPIIMLNKTEDFDAAKIFTLVHEYAHLLLRQPGISDLNDTHPVEAFCNRFAAGFLMPRSALVEILPYWPDQPVEWGFDAIAAWARKLKVSQQALSLRLEELGLAPIGYYARLVEQQRSASPREGEQGNYINTQVSEIGYRYTSAVLNAEDGAKITSAEAAEMLSLAPRYFGLVKDRLDQQFATAWG